jgi:hypothetical protein
MFKRFGRKPRKLKYYTNHDCLNSLVVYPQTELFYQFAIIDPGPKSCGLRIVRYNLVSRTITLVCFQLLSFGSEMPEIIQNIGPVLDTVRVHLENCHHIVVEFQIMRGYRNYQAFSDLLFMIALSICQNGPMRPVLVEIDPQLKTVILGGPRRKTENNSDEMKDWIEGRTGVRPANGTVEIKEWTKMRARKYAVQKGDFVTYHVLENSAYKCNEDLSDTACYEEGWMAYLRLHPEIKLPFARELID